MSKDRALFTFSTGLENLFHSSPSNLDSVTIHDLLNFYSIGTERMLNYVRDYIDRLAPPNEIPKMKHRLAKLQTLILAASELLSIVWTPWGHIKVSCIEHVL